MSELLPMELQLFAVVLAEELSVSAAAKRLVTSPAILIARIGQITTRLECSLFRREGDRVEVTEDGRVLIDAFRAFLAQRGKLPD
jgi:DNA-binding transcriptional LysR family regulator